MARRALLPMLLVLLLQACSVKPDLVLPAGDVQTPTTFDHSTFDTVLRTYVAADGLVDYEALATSDALTPYLQVLAATDPSQLSDDAQFAFWINAYNALTLKLIADNYPTRSILRLTPVGYIVPKVTTPFDVDVGYVGGEIRTLNEIEHEILRVRFEDPRLHFAIVCAAMSCPPLRTEAYVPERLDTQLADQGRSFLFDRSKNAVPVDAKTIRLSKIFDWFEEDFADDKVGLQRFLAPYFEGTVREKLEAGAYEVDYTKYDWTLNAQAYANEQPEPLPPPVSSAP